MKKIYYLTGFIVILLVLSMLYMFGCGGDDGTVINPGITPYPTTPVPNPSNVTPEYISQIESQVAPIADSALSSMSSNSNSFQNAANQIKNISGVKEVVYNSNSLTVEYNYGGIHTWLNNPLPVKPAFLPQSSDFPNNIIKSNITAEELVGNKKAVIINSLYEDPGMKNAKEPLNKMENTLKYVGYDVVRLNGSQVSVEALKNLNQYGVIVLCAHGLEVSLTSGTLITFQTGQQPLSLSDFISPSLTDLIEQRAILTTVEWGIEPEREKNYKNFWSITNKYFDYYYNSSNKSFPNSIFYNGTCQGYKSDVMAKSLKNLGVGTYIGWTETQRWGPWTCDSLFDLMRYGCSLNKAIGFLPKEMTWDQIKDPNTGNIISTAYLNYYPNTGGTIQLTNTVTPNLDISITSPTINSTSNRVITVSGNVSCTSGLSYVKGGTITVNDISTALSINSSGNFSQNVVIQSGSNKISVYVWSDKFGGVTKSFTITGNFSQSDLWTELRWDDDYTDVDLHLLSPGSTLSNLFSSKDCYFANKSTSWGAYLDVDDRNGRGPEHITIPSASSGRYTLVVHYYSDCGKYITTNAEVFVSTKNGNVIKLGPRLLSNPSSHTTDGHGSNKGDFWKLCYIDFPSGAITTVNTLTTSELEELRGKPITKE
ncbi:MAG: hypothetical protein ABRQ37_08660 [Candidatus Eremiobacterota bacterium]